MSTHGVGEFGAELRRLRATAGSRRLNYVHVDAGELHRRIGGYPSAHHRMPSCGRAVHTEMRGTGEVRSALPSGTGASLTIHYRLPR